MQTAVFMLDFLMEHDIDLVCNETKRIMAADCLYELEGEFTVYAPNNPHEIYRGDDFEDALKFLEGTND